MITTEDYWNNIDMGKAAERLGMKRKQTPDEYYREQQAKAQGIPTYEDYVYQPRTEAQREFAARCDLAAQHVREYEAQVEKGRAAFLDGFTKR